MPKMTQKKTVAVANRSGQISPSQQSQIIPHSFRLPKLGTTDPHFGGSRTFWNRQILPCVENDFKPPVRSVTRRYPGAKRGVRFILYQSALEFFRKMEEEQCEQRDSVDMAETEFAAG